MTNEDEFTRRDVLAYSAVAGGVAIVPTATAKGSPSDAEEPDFTVVNNTESPANVEVEIRTGSETLFRSNYRLKGLPDVLDDLDLPRKASDEDLPAALRNPEFVFNGHLSAESPGASRIEVSSDGKTETDQVYLTKNGLPPKSTLTVYINSGGDITISQSTE